MAQKFHCSVLVGLCALLGGFAAPLAAGPGAEAIERLSPEAFRRSGLEKLSAAELTELKEQLDAALAPESAGTATADELPRGEAAFGREEAVRQKVEARQEIPDRIASRIVGEFRGWSGDTVFRLENGQVWRQAGGGSSSVRLDSPTVTIERGALGAFFLRVEGLGARVKVKRIR